MFNINTLIGTHDILFMTLDTLRYDVAQRLFQQGRIPFLQTLLPPTGWEMRHSPGNFTFAAHQAFFAGFLPTPVTPGAYPRQFALVFPESSTIAPETCVFQTPNIVAGLAGRGYRTICIGGVGFFNKITPLGAVLPGLFQESYWSEATGVTDPDSTRHQVRQAVGLLDTLPASQRVFLFINVSALHQPNCFYCPGQFYDNLASHAAALEYVDRQLPPLFVALQRRAPLYAIICSDHGTTYGEDGYWGHRISHPLVFTVPYTECVLPQQCV